MLLKTSQQLNNSVATPLANTTAWSKSVRRYVDSGMKTFAAACSAEPRELSRERSFLVSFDLLFELSESGCSVDLESAGSVQMHSRLRLKVLF